MIRSLDIEMMKAKKPYKNGNSDWAVNGRHLGDFRNFGDKRVWTDWIVYRDREVCMVGGGG